MSWENGLEKFLDGNRCGNDPMSLRGNLLWPNGAMTPQRTNPSCEARRPPEPRGFGPLRSLSDHVAALARSPQGHRLMERIVGAGFGAETGGDLAELVRC